MPYRWTDDDNAQELRLWPHQSLPPYGFAAFILTFFAMACIPLFAVLGTMLMWGLLPFMLAAVFGLYYALRRNDRDRQVLEVLTLSPNAMHLTRHNPRGPDQDWESNPYWVQVCLHESGGPVPYYVTLTGNGREVEIGAFLSEDERKALYDDLSRAVARLGRA